MKKMKKMTLLFAAASVAMIGMQSCKKEQNHKPPINESFDIQLKANEVYTFSLPKNKRDDAYEITTQSAHFSISEVGKDVSGNRIYQYTPSLNYTGTDMVVVANVEENPANQPPTGGGGKPKPHLFPPAHSGNCNGGEEDHYIITIHFTINSSNTTNK